MVYGGLRSSGLFNEEARISFGSYDFRNRPRFIVGWQFKKGFDDLQG